MRVLELPYAWLKILAFILVAGWGAPSAAADLPDGPGKDLVQAQCGVCHSLALVAQNRMTRQGWDDTITWMQKTQNLWLIPPEMRSKILDYLEANLSPQQNTPSLLRPRINPLPTP